MTPGWSNIRTSGCEIVQAAEQVGVPAPGFSGSWQSGYSDVKPQGETC